MDPHGPEQFVALDRGLTISSASASKWKDGVTESLPTSDRFGEGERLMKEKQTGRLLIINVFGEQKWKNTMTR